LLCAHLPDITTTFTDYDLMREQTLGLTQMAVDLAGSRWIELRVSDVTTRYAETIGFGRSDREQPQKDL
jgi:hypothetical protein